MSVDNFIIELQQRSLLSERVLGKLREAAADPTRPLSARLLAKFLVQKKHLTEQQARDVINSLQVAGVNVDATGPPSTIISATATPRAEESQDDAGDVAGESSIFAPFLTGAGKQKASRQPPADEPDELTLVAIDDDSPTRRGVQDGDADDVPVLGLLVDSAAKPPRTPRKTPRNEDAEPSPAEELRRKLADDAASAVVAPLDETEAPMARRASKRRSPRESRSSRAKPGLRKKEWDSPLILYGGGGLALLLVLGGGIWWLLNWEKGDQELRLAQSASKAGAYAEAIDHYNQFLVNSPNHPEHGPARVQLATTRIRQATESSDFAAALELAPRELQAVEDEDKFRDAHGELASLLPQIAGGLATQAEQAGAGAKDANELVAKATTALELCNNVLYVPKKLRDEGQLDVIRETLRRVEHREQSHLALQETLSAMEKAIAAGDANAAYAAHKKLVKERVELDGNQKLVELLKQATAADAAAVKFVREEQPAETSDRPTPWVASLAVAQRRGNSAPSATSTNSVACVRVEGAVYGLNVADGKLLWRRFVGYLPAAWPIVVGGDVLAIDARHHELLRLNAATGRLVWRQTIGEACAEPLIVGERVFVAAKSGRLFVIDLATGGRMGYLQFPQSLGTPAASDRRQQRLYLAGDQFSLYSISLDELACLGAYHLGHEATGIQISPAQVLNKLAVLENDGVETSRLHILALDERGAIAGEETSKRMDGLSAAPLVVEGRRLIVVTDRGRFDVYEVGAGQGDAALAPVATRPVTDREPALRYVAVADGNLWVGDTRLTKYAILPTGDRLPVESIENNFTGDSFDHPLELFGDSLVSVRRPAGRAGVVVAATDTKQGRTLWETDLAVPPAAAPVVNSSGRGLAVANSNGSVFRFDEASIRTRVQDQPLAARSAPSSFKPLTGGIDLGDGRAVFFAPHFNQLLVYDPAANGGPQWVPLPSPLACAATRIGAGFLAPLEIGQVLYLNATDGKELAPPFQPKLEPRTVVNYQPAGAVATNDRQFVITDGQEKIYLVGLANQSPARFETAAESAVSPLRIVSPVAVLGETAIAAAEGARLARYKLPALAAAGDTQLPGEAVAGPFIAGDYALFATANDQLVAITTAGEIAWTAPFEHGPLAGPPLVTDSGLVLAYRKGMIERRNLKDGTPAAQRDLGQPLATGPVRFLQRLVLAADDGTLLVVDQP